MSDEVNRYDKNERRKKGKIVLIIISLLLIVFASVYAGYYLYTQYEARMSDENASNIAATTAKVDEKLAQNPIDFTSLQKKNNDIYAWIKVPGTKVDYPVVQHPDDDDFYLKHDAYTKQWSSSGAVYAELGNTNDFNDRVTVLYGHNGYGDSMFTTLHKFEESEFFSAHDKFYIYMPHRKLTYRIVSAFKFDDRHILNCFDFNNNQEFLDFEKMLLNPETNNKQVRKPDSGLTLDDNVVVLSTCFTNQRSNRYLVCGVLIKDEKTN